MMNTFSDTHVQELVQELALLDKKNSQCVVNELYHLAKIDDLPSTSKPAQDKFMVDLSSFDKPSLLLLHQYSDWQYPSYFLRKKLFQAWDTLTEDELMFLLQVRSPQAKKILFERYEGKYENAKDEVLVLMAQQEDVLALDVLIKRHYTSVKQMSYWLFKKYRPKDMDPKDIAHEGIIGLYKAVNDYKIQFKTRFKDFSKFVIDKHIGTLRNTSNNHKNRALNNSFSYHTPLKEDTEATFEDTLLSELYYPEDMFMKKEEFYAIWGILTKLERSVLILYGQGYTYEEIAQALGKDRKAVDNTRQRIRTKGERYREAQLATDKT